MSKTDLHGILKKVSLHNTSWILEQVTMHCISKKVESLSVIMYVLQAVSVMPYQSLVTSLNTEKAIKTQLNS